MSDSVTGIALAMLGGALVGNCMLPLKWIRISPWECSWLIFTFVSLFVVPCSIAWLTLPHWPALYLTVVGVRVLPALVFGMGWGVAQVLFGIAVVRLGMGLGFTLVVGLGTVFGTLIPFFARREAAALSRSSLMLLGGCLLMVIGIWLSGWAGKLRESAPLNVRGTDYRIGLLIAVISGVLSSMLNLSFSFGRPLTDAALQAGAPAALAGLAIWPVALAGGAIPNLGYSAYLLVRNRSLGKMGPVLPDVMLSFLMGLLWISAVVCYGLATWRLGRLGDSAGWAIYQITMILAASASGVVTGEWQGASHKAKSLLRFRSRHPDSCSRNNQLFDLSDLNTAPSSVPKRFGFVAQLGSDGGHP